MAGMSIYVLSDLHGADESLPKAVPEGATLLLLGDLLNVIDYIEMSGILVDLFSEETVAHVAHLRKEQKLEEARAVMAERSQGRELEVRSRFSELAAKQYEAVFARLPEPTYIILGNVDIPKMARAFVDAHPGVVDADGHVFEIEGERFGFIGGALPTPLNVAGEITEEELRRKVEGLGDVDVLCSHIPPAVPELCFDALAGKMEQGSVDLLRYIEDVQPRRAYFGHVHQPLVSSRYIGRTLCLNAGYFRTTRRAGLHIRAPR